MARKGNKPKRLSDYLIGLTAAIKPTKKLLSTSLTINERRNNYIFYSLQAG
jgi:hypothetical protein